MIKQSMNSGESPDSALADATDRRALISALADGELTGKDWADAAAWAEDEVGQTTWALYHLVGDVLRSPELANSSDPGLVGRLRAELAKEEVPRPADTSAAEVAPQIVGRGQHDAAANAAVFRWKIVAGFASTAAVAVIGWTALATWQSEQVTPAAGHIAAATAQPAAPMVAVADANGPQVMIRDPRLDELLAAHKQFGSTSTLQMPAGFLRNATFETPSR